LSDECKPILGYAAEEAERLGHRHIGTEHVLLGILREENCLASRILNGRGLRLEALREEFARSIVDKRQILDRHARFPKLSEPGVVPDADTAKRIAEAIWIPIYGSDVVNDQLPLKANLQFDVWMVSGTVEGDRTESALFAFVHKADGRILSVGKGFEKPM
jgi:hypothetical protein